MENLCVGVQSWKRAGWQGSFYPQDLPEDWQLDFYSNQFFCVLIPQEEWLQWGAERVEEVLEALEDRAFYLYFRVEAPLSEQASRQLIRLNHEIGRFCGGVLCFDGGVVLPKTLEHWHQTFCVEDVLTPVVPEGVWRWGFKGLTLWGAPLGFVKALPETAKLQTELLKNFMQSLPENCPAPAFFIEDETLDAETVVGLKTMSELLGY